MGYRRSYYCIHERHEQCIYTELKLHWGLRHAMRLTFVSQVPLKVLVRRLGIVTLPDTFVKAVLQGEFIAMGKVESMCLQKPEHLASLRRPPCRPSALPP